METVLAAILIVAIWLGPAVVAFMKGHFIEGALGLVAFPLFSWWAAIRLAKPNSVWALRRYGPEKLARSQARYGPKSGSAPERTAQPMLEPEGQETPGSGWRCLICDFRAASRAEVEGHVHAEHQPAPVESSVAAA